MTLIPYKLMAVCGRSQRCLLPVLLLIVGIFWFALAYIDWQLHLKDLDLNSMDYFDRTHGGTPGSGDDDFQEKNKGKQLGMNAHAVNNQPMNGHAVLDMHIWKNPTFDKGDAESAQSPDVLYSDEVPVRPEGDVDAIEAHGRTAERAGNKHTVPRVPDFHVKDANSSRPLAINKLERHDKWIVVTSVVPPTADVIFLSSIPGWKLLVVGDTKTPANWSCPNCVYLSVSAQESLGFHITNRLPYRSYARKNVGYLYAIAHGATVIYETDDDNRYGVTPRADKGKGHKPMVKHPTIVNGGCRGTKHHYVPTSPYMAKPMPVGVVIRPLDKLESFHLESNMSGLMFSGPILFNPYQHFGQSSLWPRGYPLAAVGADSEMTYRLSDQWEAPAIQQGVVNGDPDMDAIFRLTRKKTLSQLDVKFDPAAPPAILPEGVFSPFNSQNTLFLYRALWALLLPTTTTFRMCDIWRGYWAQRLLWEVGGHLGFFSPNAYQQRNAHSYMADAEDEKSMYFDTDRLLDFLNDWSCPRDLSFFQCVYKLSLDMAHRDFWTDGDVEITKLWLDDLIRAGYSEPKRINVDNRLTELILRGQPPLRNPNRTGIHANASTKSLPSDLDIKWAVTVRQGSFIQYVASEQDSPSVIRDSSRHNNRVSTHASQIAALCPNVSVIAVSSDALKSKNQSHFHDILLVVVFNWPFYSNIRVLEVMYRSMFPNIAYCGDNATKFQESTLDLDHDVTFIEAPTGSGLIGYTCVVHAMRMSYNVTGYLIVGDDVILNTWNFYSFDKNRVWMMTDVFHFNVTVGTDWMWWSWKVGAPAYHSAMAELQHGKPAHDGVVPVTSFLSMLSNNTGGRDICPHALNDVYYIPTRLRPSTVFYLSHFARHSLMTELAVALTLFGMEGKQNIQYFKGTSLWLNERLNPWSRYSPDAHFLHPVKFSNQTNISLFCQLYLGTLVLKGHNYKTNVTGL